MSGNKSERSGSHINDKAVKNFKDLNFGNCSCGHYYISKSNINNHKRRCLEDANAQDRRLKRLLKKRTSGMGEVSAKTTNVEFNGEILDGMEVTSKVKTEREVKASEEKVVNENPKKPPGNVNKVVNKVRDALEEENKKKSLKGFMNVLVSNQEADIAFTEFTVNLQNEIKPDPMEDVFQQESIQEVSCSIAVQTVFTSLGDELQLFH